MTPRASRTAVPASWFAFEPFSEPTKARWICGDGWCTASELHEPVVGRAHLSGPLLTAAPALVITDADSTLLNEEVIDCLAEFAGVGPKVAQITEQAMNGHLDFGQALRERVALLEGLPQDTISEVTNAVTLTPGAKVLVDWVKRVGGKFGVVSGGFQEVLEPIAKDLGVDYLLGNQLEIKDGKLTGKIEGPVVDAQAKLDALTRWSHGDLAATVAVGDGANDIPMIQAAGAGFAFCAKQPVRQASRNWLAIRRLDAVAGLLGWNPSGS